jgi:hypothetical protein
VHPRDRLDIQVLDDSTDETRAIADNAVRRWQSLGLDITLIHRADRTGFKAGALENGLRTVRERFDLDTFLQRYHEIFQEALAAS